MNAMPISSKSRLLLMKCIAVSLAVHAAGLLSFYFHPLVLHSPFQSLFGITAATPTLLKSREEDAELLQANNRTLKEVFENIVVFSPHFQQPYDLIELPKGLALAPNEEDGMIDPPGNDFFPALERSKQQNSFALPISEKTQDQRQEDLPALFSPQEIGAPFASQLQIDANPAIGEIPLPSIPIGEGNDDNLVVLSDFSLAASFETDYSLNLSPQLASPNSLKIGEDLQLKADIKSQAALVEERHLNLENEKVRSTLFVPKSSHLFTEKRELAVSSPPLAFEHYKFPPLATASEWDSQFDVDIVFLPNPEGQGYIFSLSVHPGDEIHSHSLKQNLYFILDRSNSVQKHRFAVFKRAVLKALTSMQHGDAFNILIIDKKLTAFSPENRPVTMRNIQAAEEFLDKQEAGGLFAAAEMLGSLDKILATIPDNEEMHTAVLLTDGKSGMNNERKQNMLKKWVEKNNGKLSVYAAAVGRDNDLLTLDMLTSLSGGRLLYSDTHAALPRKLAKLVLDLKDPVAKELMITALPHHPHSRIEFYPAGSHLPSLYSHQPFVLIGQIDDPCSFDLVIQGRNRDEWISINKNVSFVNGQKGTQALELQWSGAQANLCYAKFLKEGKGAHLKEAKEILKKSRREIAFE